MGGMTDSAEMARNQLATRTGPLDFSSVLEPPPRMLVYHMRPPCMQPYMYKDKRRAWAFSE
jgi:hypothetical protein